MIKIFILSLINSFSSLVSSSLKFIRSLTYFSVSAPKLFLFKTAPLHILFYVVFYIFVLSTFVFVSRLFLLSYIILNEPLFIFFVLLLIVLILLFSFAISHKRLNLYLFFALHFFSLINFLPLLLTNFFLTAFIICPSIISLDDPLNNKPLIASDMSNVLPYNQLYHTMLCDEVSHAQHNELLNTNKAFNLYFNKETLSLHDDSKIFFHHMVAINDLPLAHGLSKINTLSPQETSYILEPSQDYLNFIAFFVKFKDPLFFKDSANKWYLMTKETSIRIQDTHSLAFLNSNDLAIYLKKFTHQNGATFYKFKLGDFATYNNSTGELHQLIECKTVHNPEKLYSKFMELERERYSGLDFSVIDWTNRRIYQKLFMSSTWTTSALASITLNDVKIHENIIREHNTSPPFRLRQTQEVTLTAFLRKITQLKI